LRSGSVTIPRQEHFGTLRLNVPVGHRQEGERIFKVGNQDVQ